MEKILIDVKKYFEIKKLYYYEKIKKYNGKYMGDVNNKVFEVEEK